MRHGAYLILLLFSAAWVRAQALPLVAGATLETGSGLLAQGRQGNGMVRLTPFLGAWLQGLGYVRIGYSPWDYKQTDSTGLKTTVRQRDISVQAGVSLGGADRPYVALTYVRARSLGSTGDSEWNEWGAGLGHRFTLSPYAAIVTEAEYRVISEHYDRARDLDVSGSRLQLNLGFAVYVY